MEKHRSDKYVIKMSRAFNMQSKSRQLEDKN